MGGLGLRVESDICPCSDSLPACECVAISSFTGERFSRGTDSVCAVLLGELKVIIQFSGQSSSSTC